MTTAKAINNAMALFEKEGRGDIRTVNLMEGSGANGKWTQLTIQIGYAIDGDYTESDKNPYMVNVVDNGGKIEAAKI